MWKEGKILLLAIATDFSNKLLTRLARYTVSSLPRHILHDEPKHLLQGTSKNVSLLRPCEASALVKRKIRARRRAAPGSCSRVPVLFTRATGSQGSGFCLPRGERNLVTKLSLAPNPARSTCPSHYS